MTPLVCQGVVIISGTHDSGDPLFPVCNFDNKSKYKEGRSTINYPNALGYKNMAAYWFIIIITNKCAGKLQEQ